MKLRVGDLVLVTGGKDKGKQAKVTRVLPKVGKVVVEGVNMYVKHVKPMGEREGTRTRKERPLPLANVAIINDKGQVDRVGYQVSKDGTKTRIFKKTGQVITAGAQKAPAAKKTATKAESKPAPAAKAKPKKAAKK
jgi:large subunit ribosomal protein L24